MIMTTELTAINTIVKAKLITDFVEFAVGSGTTAETAADTVLDTETLQQALQEYSSLSDRIVFSGFVGSGQINATTINELGWKTAASGTLLQRKVITAFAKTSAKEFWSDLVIVSTVTQT